MPKQHAKATHYLALMGLSAVAIANVVLVRTAAAQDSLLVTPQTAPGTVALALGGFGGVLSFSAASTAASAGSQRWQASDTHAGEPIGDASSREGNPVRSHETRRITLEQVKQKQFLNPAITSPLARLSQLSIEAAKQHRLGVQADYLPKIGATFANLHYSEFLGQVLSVHRPLAGSTLQLPVPLFSQDQTVAAITFVQPITPLFQVHQAVQIARADERIAMAKAGISITKLARDTDIDETYFKLLIAQRRLTSAELKVRSTENQPLYAAAAIESVGPPGPKPEFVEARKALLTTAAEIKELTASLNREMGWSDDTDLELVPPDPLVENISLEEVADKPLTANPDVIEAEQTVVKARAASMLSKLAYVPAVGAVSGYLFQNAIPLVPRSFGYGGVMVSYNIFDFGKRERAVKEATAQLGMAEIAVQMTKAKVSANLRKSYSELEHARQLSQLAQQMGSSVSRLIKVGFAPDTIEGKAAVANLETEMFEADLAHRQAYAHLKALMGGKSR
jgi:outer membrane protein TolC